MRPKLTQDISLQDFKAFTWLIPELRIFCRSAGLFATGGRAVLTKRIVHFIENGRPAEQPLLTRNIEVQARPRLSRTITVQDFRAAYWMKDELTAFCRKTGLNATGGKVEIADRIARFLETGEVTDLPDSKAAKPTSDFDWNSSQITPDTIITDSYRNTQQVRKLFKQEIGRHFRFNTGFMKWMKENIGSTLRDAAAEWQRLHKLKKDKSYVTEIGPQFEYNRYMRAFLTDNPDLATEDAMRYWKLKRDQPGSHAYDRTDLQLG